jgi:hypothetical protein
MRGVVRGVTPLWSIPMRERTRFSAFIFILESGGAHAPNCTKDCQYCHTTCKKLKLKYAYHCSVQYHACGPLPRAGANPRETKTPLVFNVC